MQSLSMRCTVAGVGLLAALTASAAAEEWPVSPIRIVVGAGPGGGTDVVSRIIGQPLSEILHQPVVVENKTGSPEASSPGAPSPGRRRMATRPT
jgi:tripartite-type tricarboxylate transporter receptor subunit TctC